MKKNLAIFFGVLILIFIFVIVITLFIFGTPPSELTQDPAYYQTLNDQMWTVKLAVIVSFFIFMGLVTLPVCVIYFVLIYMDYIKAANVMAQLTLLSGTTRHVDF